MITNMTVSFVAFIGSTPLDFYGKIVLDALAIVLVIGLAGLLRTMPSP